MSRNTERKSETRLLTAVFLFWFSVYTYPSFLTAWAVEGLGATTLMAGMIVGSYGLTQMILRIPLGILSDVLKKRKPFVMLGFGLSMLASAGLTLLSVLAGGENIPGWLPAAALLFRGISGMTAATWVNFSVLYTASCRGDRVAAAMSRVVVPQCGSQVVAMLLGAQLAGSLGERYAFLLALLAGCAGLIVMARVEEQRPAGEPMTLRGLLTVAGNRELITGTVLATVYQLVVWATVQGFVQNWARDVIGLSTAELGWLSVAHLLPNTVVSRFSGTALEPRFGRRAVLVAGFVCLAGACFLYPFTRSFLSLLLVQALLGTGVGLMMPLTMAGAIETVPEEKRGAAMGIYQAVYGLGMFLGPVIAGAIIERFSETAGEGVNVLPGYIANFRAAMIISVIGGILALLLTGRKPESREGSVSGSRSRPE